MGGAPQPGWPGGAAPAPQPGAPAPQAAWQGATPAPGASTGGGPELRICGSCGAIAPTQRTECVSCNASLASPLVVHDAATGFWVGVECGFNCSVCGNFSPLNYLDNDGEVQCARCGTEQRFDSSQWWEGLSLAHSVGDLAGPAPEGRFPVPGAPSIADENMYKPIGVDKTFAEHQQQGMIIDGSGMRQHSLKVRALPGHPLCDKCNQPLRVKQCAGGVLSVQCPACNNERTYARPEGIPHSLQALGGVLAMDHEQGGRHADVQQDQSGALAIRCPNCTAPLDFDGKSTVIRCKFCDIAVRIPSTTLRSLGNADPKQLRWWLYFTDVSEERKKLAKKAEAKANKERKEQEKARQRALSREQALAAGASGSHHKGHKKKKPAANRQLVSVMVSMSLVSLGAGVVFMLTSRSHSTSHSTTGETAARTRSTTRATATARTYPKLELTWKGKVTKTSGVKGLVRGASCVVDAQVQGARVHWVTVSCGKQQVYDSRTRASGFINMSSNVAEAPAEKTPGAFTYALDYSNTGQISGRPQASLNTFVRQGVVYSTVPPIMRVEMKLDSASEPRTGEPMFDTPKAAPHVKWTGTVSELTGKAPVKMGASCTVEVAFGDREIKQAACNATVKCGRRYLYGDRKHAGGGKCDLDKAGTPQAIFDTTPASKDQTPLFSFDALNKTASVNSDDYHVGFKLSR